MKKKSAALLCIALILGACSNSASISSRKNLATDITHDTALKPEIINAAPFALTSYKRINAPSSQTANIYIEGDGLAWLSRSTPSSNPTPSDPIALRLASVDPSQNVIYLARPCQYSGRVDGKPCEQKYWMSSRYAPEVLNSYNTALNSIKNQYGFTSFNLIGFSGGGTIAALLAGQRNDITSLRTIAGNLDHIAHSKHHDVSILSSSLNPPDYAATLRNIPQHHFIGENDKIVPEAIYQSYANKIGNSSCLNVSLIPNTTHTDGWVNQWPELLKQKPICQ